MRAGIFACCSTHGTLQGSAPGRGCPYCGRTLFLSDSLNKPIKIDPFDFSKLPTYRDPMFDFVEDVEVFVELGTQRGFTAYRAAIHLPRATIYCVDPWKNYEGIPKYVGDMKLCWEIFKALHAENLKSGKVVAWKGFSWDVALTFVRPIDLLWIDGDHTFEGVTKDFSMWVPQVRSGGVVVGDNYEMDDVRMAVDSFAHANGIDFHVGRCLGKKRRKRLQFWFTKE